MRPRPARDLGRRGHLHKRPSRQPDSEPPAVVDRTFPRAEGVPTLRTPDSVCDPTARPRRTLESIRRCEPSTTATSTRCRRLARTRAADWHADEDEGQVEPHAERKRPGRRSEPHPGAHRQRRQSPVIMSSYSADTASTMDSPGFPSQTRKETLTPSRRPTKRGLPERGRPSENGQPRSWAYPSP